MDSENIRSGIALAEGGYNVRDLKAHLSEILNGLDAGPAVIKQRNRPTAMIVNIAQYQDILAKAEAYELLQIAEEAEREEQFPVGEARQFLSRRSEERRSSRDASQKVD